MVGRGVPSPPMWIAVFLLGCGDDGGKKRGLGANCGADEQCASGLCGAGICLDPDADNDLDGLVNRLEANLKTDPTNVDSDGDGKLDFDEVADLARPADRDGDGKVDAAESSRRDADADCISDERDPRDDTVEGDLAVVADLQCCCAGRCSVLEPAASPTAACTRSGSAAVLACTLEPDDGLTALYPCDAALGCERLDGACTEGQWNAKEQVCVAVPWADGSACDDGDACTAADACAGGTCVGAAITCDDAIACTVDFCEAADGCRHDASSCECAADGDCDDDDVCNGHETCDLATLACSGGTTLDCDDGVECSIDGCDPLDGCRHDTAPCDTLEAVAAGPTRIDLSWTYSGAEADAFEIEYGAVEMDFTPVAVVEGEARAHAVTGLAPSTTYVCRVRAVVADVAASWVVSEAVTTPSGLPTAPTDLELVVVDSTRVDLAWAHDGIDVDGFAIEADEGGQGFVEVALVDGAARAYAHTALTPSTEYAYRVSAVNAFGRSSGVEGGPVTTLSTELIEGVTLADSLVTVRDSQGVERTTTSSGAGERRYALDVAGLVGPFLLRVDGGDARDLYAVATGPGVANINVVSDLLIGGWYALHGLAVEDVFDAVDETTPMPTDVEIATLTLLLRDVTLRAALAHGVDPVASDALTTLYPTDGTGWDAVLGLTSAGAARDTVTIEDDDATRACRQLTGLAWDAATALVTMDTTTTCSGGRESRSRYQGLVPTSQELRDAAAGVTTSLTLFKDTVNAGGTSLRAGDISPGPAPGFFAADFLHDGADETIFAAQVASIFRGARIEVFVPNRILAYDRAAGVLTVEVLAAFSVAGASAEERLVLPFKDRGADGWGLYGNQHYATGEADIETRTTQGAFEQPTALHINVDVRAPAGRIATVEIMESAGTVWPTFTAISQQGFNELEYLLPNPPPAPPLEVESDVWFTGTSLSDPADLPPGTVFTFRLTPTAAGEAAGLTVQTFEVVATGITNESVVITKPTGSTLSAANLGGTLDVEWTELPASFAVTRVDLGASFRDLADSVECSTEDESGVLAPTSTSGTLQMLSTCDGKSIGAVNVNLGIDGPHGERTHVIHIMENSP